MLKRFGDLWIDPALVIAACIHEEEDWRREKIEGTERVPAKWEVRVYFVGRHHGTSDSIESGEFTFPSKDAAELLIAEIVEAANAARGAK